MIEQLVAILEQKFKDLTAEEIADILWLTLQQWQTDAATLPTPQSIATDTNSSTVESIDSDPVTLPITGEQPAFVPAAQPPQMAGLTTRPQVQSQSQTASTMGAPLAIPDAPALRNTLEILKALRPLILQEPAIQGNVLDIPATVKAIAETDLWSLQLRPVLEPWLELAIVVDATASMVIWQRTILSLRRVLAQSGVFRDVRMWSLETQDRTEPLSQQQSPDLKLCIRSGFGPAASLQSPCRPQELIDPNGRRLILVVSDCIAPRWDTQQIRDILAVWAKHGPLALIQVLPEWMWNRTALSEVVKGHVYSLTPGQANQSLTFVRREQWRRKSPSGVKVPVTTLEPAVVSRWSQMVAGKGTVSAPALLFPSVHSEPSFSEGESQTQTLTAEQRLEQFRNFSSPMARRLAGLLASCPEVNLPIVRMVQDAMLPDSQQVHVAEVLLGGLFKPQVEITAHTPADQVQYLFHEGVQPLVQDTIPSDRAFAALSAWLNHRFGYSLEDFRAYVTAERIEEIKPFAGVLLDVLKRRGTEYANIVDAIEHSSQVTTVESELTEAESLSEPDFPALEILEFTTAQLVESSPASSFPQLQTQEVEVVTIAFETESIFEAKPTGLQIFEFESATIERSLESRTEPEPRKSGFFQNLFGRGERQDEKRSEWVIRKQRRQAQRWVERLGNGIQLEMVAIPAGRFMMGSPENELERGNNEGPQHEVTVSSFLMGRYPVTQAQWRFVAELPQVSRKLKPNPSNFKGDDCPVEKVSWHYAVEFCERLSAHTRRDYCLPSEAEWEYACRAGTQTPFHFGETLTAELANYNSNYTYNDGPKGEHRRKTTPVGQFGVANLFGLCDMHGNVREWCADHRHGNYEGAPTSGTAWLSEGDQARRVIRGGSWDNTPWYCRSAARRAIDPDIALNDLGFRVVCSAPRTF